MENTSTLFEQIVSREFTIGEVTRAEESAIVAARKWNNPIRKRLRAMRDNYQMVKRSYQS